ncbi:YlbF family regulator [Lactococcus lactis]
MHYDDLVDLLVEKIKSLDYVKDFQQAETALMANQELFKAQEEMKALQKEAVLYQKIDKIQAYKKTSQSAQVIEKRIKHHPLVKDYATKLEDVNDLVQYITGELEEKVNLLLETGE